MAETYRRRSYKISWPGMEDKVTLYTAADIKDIGKFLQVTKAGFDSLDGLDRGDLYPLDICHYASFYELTVKEAFKLVEVHVKDLYFSSIYYKEGNISHSLQLVDNFAISKRKKSVYVQWAKAGLALLQAEIKPC